jgi:putative aldouronate transport system substrate-binding protein
MNSDPNQDPVAKEVENLTGYKVNYSLLPQDNPVDKLNLVLASGDGYDVIVFDQTQVFQNYAKKGAMAQLDKLIDQYGPNIKSATTKETFDAFKVDGKIFSIPWPKPASDTVSSTLAVRQDWLDKLNMKAPKTLDEFTDMLKAFRDKDPGGNGSKNIPLVINESMADVMTTDIRGAFGLYSDWNDINGKLVYLLQDPALKDYLTYMSMLYKEKLIDQELPTNKGATVDQKWASGRAGVRYTSWGEFGGHTDNLVKNVPTAKLSLLEFLTGKDGKSGTRLDHSFEAYAFIREGSKNKEDAIKWMNAKLEPKNFKTITIGEEGKLHTVQDGKYVPILPQFFEQKANATSFLTGTDSKAYAQYWQARLKKDPRIFDTFQKLQQMGTGKGKVDVMGLATTISYDQALAKDTEDFLVKVIVGAEPVSAVDDFSKKWLSRGGDQIIKDVNTWYDGYKKNK